MLQLKNNTPFSAQLALFPNEHGIDSLYIIVKASFVIGKQWTLADEQKQPQNEDEYWGEDPQTSSLKYASDMHIGKPATDVILLGHARALNDQPVSNMLVTLTIADITTSIKVFGDRCWTNGAISKAEPFTSIPLTYEKAFGGVVYKENEVIAGEPRNPIGIGFTNSTSAKDVEGDSLPNLEHPDCLIKKPGDIVPPVSLGFISPSWQPRLSFAGTYDEAWEKNQAPYLPKDFDLRFFNMSHPSLSLSKYLIGGEIVSIQGVHPNGDLQFSLPVVEPCADVFIESRIEHPIFNLETILIDTDQLQLELTWKASILCDKSTLNIKQVIVNLSRNQSKRVA